MTHQQDEIKSIISSLHHKTKIKFSEKDIDSIIKNLPSIKEPIQYRTIFQLSGKHYPCIHQAIPNISRRVKMKKSEDGKFVTFCCDSVGEAETAVSSINSLLGKSGYEARSQNKRVTFRTSENTSLSPLLSKLGYLVLYCEHSREKEIITFGKPALPKQSKSSEKITKTKDKEKYLQKIIEKCPLRQAIEDTENKARKEGKNVSLPKTLKFLGSDITLPNCQLYSSTFIEFLIKERPTKKQLKTYLVLYHLAEIGIPFSNVQERQLVKIIHRYYNNNKDISIDVLEKHLIDTKQPLHMKLSEIFNPVKLEVNVHTNFNLIREESSILVT